MVLKKHHFTRYKYNIVHKGLIKKDVFLKIWNESVADKQGIYFRNLEEKLEEDQFTYIKFFSCYLIENPDIYILDIMNDGRKKYREFEHHLSNLTDVISIDFINCLKILKEDGKSINELFNFTSGSLPLIFKLYEKEKVSIHMLIAFNLAFGFFKKINKENLNIIESLLFDKYFIIFNKFQPIVINYYKNIEFKKLFTSLIS